MKRTIFPPGPKNWYPLRIALAMRRDPISFLTYVARRFGDFSHFRVGKQHIYLLNHPDYLRPVLVSDADRFIKTGGLLRAKGLLGEGLLTSEGEKHRRQRRLIQPSFHHQKLNAYASTMVECAVDHRNSWRDDQQVDMVEEMRRVTLKIIGKTMFGVDIEQEAGEALEDFARAVRFMRLFDSMSPVLTWKRRFLRRKKSRARVRHDEVVWRIIDKRRQTENGKEDLLSRLFQTLDRHAPETGMTKMQLRDEVMTILEAGHESTAMALSWTWYLLSQNPDVDQKMHQELTEVLAGRAPAADDLAQLPYTVNIFNEALRLFPPSWVLSRSPTSDYQLNGHCIPAGSLILMSQYVMHHDKRFFAQPDRFMPERWAQVVKTPANLSYLPFGHGPRRCIGDGFAMVEGPLLLATLGSCWRAELVSGHKVEKMPLIILRPNSLPMILRKRQACAIDAVASPEGLDPS